VTFKSEKDRETYITHPDHKAFGKVLGPVLEDVFVIDFGRRIDQAVIPSAEIDWTAESPRNDFVVAEEFSGQVLGASRASQTAVSAPWETSRSAFAPPCRYGPTRGTSS